MHGRYNPLDNAIYYNEGGQYLPEGSAEYWTAIRSAAVTNYNNMIQGIDQDINLNTMANYLRGQAESEYQKEVQVLKDFFGVTSLPTSISKTHDYHFLIKALNQKLNLEGAFERMVAAIKNIDPELDKLGRLTPASLFGRDFARLLGHYLAFYFESNWKNFINGNFNVATLQQDIERLAGEALVSNLSHNYGKKGETNSIFQEAANVIKANQELRALFGADVFTRYDLPGILNTIREDFMGKDIFEEVAEDLAASLTINSRFKQLDFQSVAGTVAEYISGAIRGFTIGTHGTTIQTGKTGTADIVSIIGKGDFYDATLQAKYDDSIIKSREDSVKKIEEFQSKLDSSLKESAIIYENIKKYNLGVNFRGFRGGTRNLENIRSLLNEVGLGSADAFISAIRQSMSYAILSGQRQHLQQGLAVTVAQFLFDDFQTIGASKDRTAIHILDLSNILVPLSFLLYTLSQAMQEGADDVNRIVRTQINYNSAKEQMYHYPIEGSGAEYKPSTAGSRIRWQNQAAAADSITITLIFLGKFKQFFNGGIESLF